MHRLVGVCRGVDGGAGWISREPEPDAVGNGEKEIGDGERDEQPFVPWLDGQNADEEQSYRQLGGREAQRTQCRGNKIEDVGLDH